MRKISILIVLFVFSINASDRFVISTKENAEVYLSQVIKLYEQPLFTVSYGEHLQVIDNSKEKYKVRDSKMREGWIEKSSCKTAPRGTRFEFNETTVQGYIDIPQSMIVFSADEPESGYIRLDRSFSDALRENVDKEQMERRVRL